MKTNIGKKDKVARIVIGLVLIGAGIYAKSWFGLVGLIPLTTAFIGWCPAYLPFGINTCKMNQHKEGETK